MHRFVISAAVAALSFATSSIAADINDYVLLVPDSRNGMVHQIAADGTYEGDFMAAASAANPALAQTQWQSPRGLLSFDDAPGTLWMITERSLSEWTTRGEYKRTIYHDTMQLEDANCIVRAGDEIFVVSEDKKTLMAFARDGSFLRSIGKPELDRVKDCKVGPDGSIYVAGAMRGPQIGLISVWDPKATDADAKPVRRHVLPETGDDGTVWLTGLLFDDDGTVLVTDFSRGRLERWDLKTDKKVAVLLDRNKPGAYGDLVRGPDGLVYMTGRDGLYRFDSHDGADKLATLAPFFRTETIAKRLAREFTPVGLTFVPRTQLAPAAAASR